MNDKPNQAIAEELAEQARLLLAEAQAYSDGTPVPLRLEGAWNLMGDFTIMSDTYNSWASSGDYWEDSGCTWDTSYETYDDAPWASSDSCEY